MKQRGCLGTCGTHGTLSPSYRFDSYLTLLSSKSICATGHSFLFSLHWEGAEGHLEVGGEVEERLSLSLES